MIVNQWTATALASILSLACTRAHGASPSDAKHAKDAPKLPYAAEPPAAERVPTHRVAVTIDDLGNTDLTVVPEYSKAILAQTKAAGAPVAVFANCRHLRPDVLRLWQEAGATIGNHTAAHLSVEDGEGPAVSDAWWSGVTGCHAELTRLLGAPPRYFRFPFLHYGLTPERRDDAATRLAGIGYRVAHVTAAMTEWLLAEYYDDALNAGDATLARDLAARYVTYMVETLDAAEALANAKGTGPVPQITLLHVNRLAADHLGEVLRALRARGWAFVTMEEALADPVYSRRDQYAGHCGCSWLARIEPPLQPGAPYAFADYESQFLAEFGPRVAALPRQGP